MTTELSPPKKSRKASSAEGAFSHRASHEDLYAMGAKRRDKCPRSSHAEWKAPHDRPSPLRLMAVSNKGRVPHLIPIRHGRMLQTPFTFYRGAAMNMAWDLSRMPSTGLRVQACGDCHLLNYGCFATPERRVIADINDFDETLPAPWEWDVKRLAASFVLASRNNGFRARDARDAATACVRSYREHMAELSEMGALDIWYTSVDVEKVLATVSDRAAQRRFRKRFAKAQARNVMEHDFPELVAKTRTQPTIRDNPPLIFHWSDRGEAGLARVRKALETYRASLPEHRRMLLDRFKLTDIAFKVVGVGSVGTECFVALFMASAEDPLFLQIKQARPSVLAAFAGKSAHASDGERIVNGCHLMQAASDLFLGWTVTDDGRSYYIRQLKDMKIKPLVEVFTPTVMSQYAEVCGWVLARAHARTGEPAMISGYLGKSDKFDKALGDFAVAYADQTERDHAILKRAVRLGKLDVVIEESP